MILSDIESVVGASTRSDSKSSRGGSVTSRGSTGQSVSSNSLTSARLKMESNAAAGAKSGAAATALSSFRAPLGSSRDRSQLRTGSSETMSTASNVSGRSNASGLVLFFLELIRCVL